jgi:CrcB protein
LRAVSVFVGGAFGGLARWGIATALVPAANGFPLATFVINATGAFGLAFTMVMILERMAPSRNLRPLIGIGFFGAYTTFSTLAVEGVRLIAAGRVETAVFYWAATVAVGQMAGVYGMWLARIRFARVKEEA